MQNLSVPRPNKTTIAQIFSHGEQDGLFEEAVRLKQQNYDLRDENSRLKTLVKMHDQEIVRKEKAMEDFLSQN